jgi:hypothetical protein
MGMALTWYATSIGRGVSSRCQQRSRPFCPLQTNEHRRGMTTRSSSTIALDMRPRMLHGRSARESAGSICSTECLRARVNGDRRSVHSPPVPSDIRILCTTVRSRPLNRPTRGDQKSGCPHALNQRILASHMGVGHVLKCSHGGKTFRAARRKWSTKLCKHETHQCPA